ncbi:MAG: class I tRNA ligase family protein, partial [Acidimicrobiia bacterium]|nr:class I tRNA ligase family protein [Acidimicrobiia bacterium]
VVGPLDLFESHGADALRLYHLFMGPPTDDTAWDTNGVDGTYRFLDRLWRVTTDTSEFAEAADSGELLAEMHRTIKKVTEDIDRFRFNTAIPPLMTLTNSLIDATRNGIEESVFGEVVDTLAKLLSPMAPHIAHELWEVTGHDSMLATEPWPEWDPEMIKEASVTMVVQVNGKLRDRIEVDADITAEAAEERALESEKIRAWLDGKTVRKVIVREPNLVNIVVG